MGSEYITVNLKGLMALDEFLSMDHRQSSHWWRSSGPVVLNMAVFDSGLVVYMFRNSSRQMELVINKLAFAGDSATILRIQSDKHILLRKVIARAIAAANSYTNFVFRQ